MDGGVTIPALSKETLEVGVSCIESEELFSLWIGKLTNVPVSLAWFGREILFSLLDVVFKSN